MTAAAVHCISCQKPFRVLPEQAGRKVRCPFCSGMNQVAASLFELRPAPERVAPEPAPLRELVESVDEVVKEQTRPIGERGQRALLTGIHYTASPTARLMGAVAVALFMVAIVTQVYILVMTDWTGPRGFFEMPLSMVFPVIGLMFLPAASIAVTGFFLLGLSHCMEYLARLAQR